MKCSNRDFCTLTIDKGHSVKATAIIYLWTQQDCSTYLKTHATLQILHEQFGDTSFLMKLMRTDQQKCEIKHS